MFLLNLYRIYNKWVGEYLLITAKSEQRAIEIMDENYILDLKKEREDCLKYNGDTTTIDEFLTNNSYRLSLYEIEKLEGDIAKEGVIDSFVSLGCH